jgi:hypothetical protein
MVVVMIGGGLVSQGWPAKDGGGGKGWPHAFWHFLQNVKKKKKKSK